MADWHRRVAHLSVDELVRIVTHNLVDGLTIKGKMSRACNCETCRVAKIRRTPTFHSSLRPNVPTSVGDIVSADVKVVPAQSFKGYRYMVIYVDHYSRMKFAFFLRKKTEVPGTLKVLLKALKREGHKLRRVQTDRGSEFFAQEGETSVDRDRASAEFQVIAEEADVLHVVTAVECHEHLAEGAIKDIFGRLNSVLFEPRLCPAFWADGAAYIVHIMNRTPHSHVAPATPHQIYSGKRSDWRDIKVFGADVCEHIPNNEFAKVPGIPRGRRLIFVGFDENKRGWKCFHPESRSYRVVQNAYFYENFTHRIDALRHHDRRRQLMRDGQDQPIVLDDYDPETVSQIDAVRSLYLDADASTLEGVFDSSMVQSLSSVVMEIPNKGDHIHLDSGCTYLRVAH